MRYLHRLALGFVLITLSSTCIFVFKDPIWQAYISLTDSNDLYNENDQKEIVQVNPDSIFLFIGLDLNQADISAEFSKLNFTYYWLKFIRQYSEDRSITLILVPTGGSDDRKAQLKSYMVYFKQELPNLHIVLEGSKNFRNKYGLNPKLSLLTIFDNSLNPKSVNLQSIADLYSVDTLSFINSKINFIGKLIQSSEPNQASQAS